MSMREVYIFKVDTPTKWFSEKKKKSGKVERVVVETC